jgi:hypothetical protein
MSDTKPLNLRQKLVQVYSMIDHVEKAGRNEKQRYNFVRAADVLRSVRDAFAQLGIYAETNYELLGTYDIKTNSGGIMHTATVKATIKLYDCDSSETMTITGLGDGADSGDKGIFKAQTGSTKNALRNACLMPDEADPEADEDVDTRTTGNYSHPESTMEMPDYNDFRGTEALSRPAAPHIQTSPFREVAEESARPTRAATPEAKETGATSAAGSPATVFKSVGVPAGGLREMNTPERGDAYEEPEVAKLPTEAEMEAYRARFTELANQLSSHGKLTASRGLKLNQKLLVFFLQITKADAAKNVTTAQWDNFFERVDTAIKNPEVGLIGLTKLINAANGLETKK